MSIADVHLLDHQLAIRQMESGGCANGITSASLTRGMAGKHSGNRLCALDREQQIELQEAVPGGCLIVVEERIFPLIADGEMEQTVDRKSKRLNSSYISLFCLP